MTDGTPFAFEGDRRQWLEQVAAACESVLADEASAALHEDAANLLKLLTAEIHGPEP